jgi:hypothetical protein
MQQIIVEKPYQFIPPMRGELLPSLIQRLKLTDYFLDRFEGIEDYELRGIEHLRESLGTGASVLLAPNHSRNADALVMGWVSRVAGKHVYAMASWHLFHQSRFRKFAIRAMGGFSIFREGLDRQSLDTAIELLAEARRPLILFPEGAVFRTNDILQPLLDGVAFLARTAARRREKRDGGRVVVHPVAIKYVFDRDLDATLRPVLVSLEKRLTWAPDPDANLLDRLARLTLAMLTLKEIEYFGTPQTGSAAERQSRLIDHLLGPLEEKWIGSRQANGLIPRIKQLRMQIVPKLTSEPPPTEVREKLWRDLSRIYLAQQVASYPPSYLQRPTTVTRLLETTERLEEDITDQVTIHRGLKAVIEIGPALTVTTERPPRDQEDPLMYSLRTELQAMLNRLATEAQPYA